MQSASLVMVLNQHLILIKLLDYFKQRADIKQQHLLIILELYIHYVFLLMGPYQQLVIKITRYFYMIQKNKLDFKILVFIVILKILHLKIYKTINRQKVVFYLFITS
ncbi:unnamed protein product (macronuclear) [Paramecium tetraurelia]|uniref:Transmembrane protein n=1 Tax=Paramecium tetraurelia TaxID=5888 RepID=A0DEA1_PARTE|nr:uncharacterized protein GSPATT00039452001 [Paramecium tetraurelia]CAK81368.1 unnamed protein product [Paramecium tetraurelia]|eukprot:XP_001448765.1 hypothetical protein (macronuclear) [Paramecium tetraurelia strain d4-2]